ncbi:hypothetical protein EV363DRAFT_1334582 [Boletus edulis]|uniref:Uncharacterized protein n=1 Tax=Boletus edulis BED1 TaxID=1328754 RepID=A0AAD4GMS2_BOLED|nr:hypothetical protein EV363DRAFT_1369779 [Boletus edulis]KAF8130832.1 hypothetical protein EV363DRAFT_1334582 [Boletus edulis]KAF8415041.1 hypothetical protein L210DRAFT_3588358 [Boletus edulis BED1]KAF8452004.1 hypothetical protein L210DRAFT_3515680 [Boletus edulis BED1]
MGSTSGSLGFMALMALLNYCNVIRRHIQQLHSTIDETHSKRRVIKYTCRLIVNCSKTHMNEYLGGVSTGVPVSRTFLRWYAM